MSSNGKSLGYKIVMSKITREDYARFQQYCDMNNETPNACLKRMITEEIDNPNPAKIAGKSIFEYDRQKDNFAWKIILDDNSTLSIDENLPANTVEQLLESLMDAVDKRNSFVKKSMRDSVSIPSKLMRKKR